jgi:hypothetical protein
MSLENRERRIVPSGSLPHFGSDLLRWRAHNFCVPHERDRAACHLCGFLLRNSDHNVAVRLHAYTGAVDLEEVTEGDADLYENYREMAIANGVDPDDPVLQQCRGNNEEAAYFREKHAKAAPAPGK